MILNYYITFAKRNEEKLVTAGIIDNEEDLMGPDFLTGISASLVADKSEFLP